MKVHNNNCDGSHCREAVGEVRLYPLGGGANLILCHACFAHENRYRYERAQELVRGQDRAQGRRGPLGLARLEAEKAFPQVNWTTAKRYPEE